MRNYRKLTMLIMFTIILCSYSKINAASVPTIKYQSHVQRLGWRPYVTGGKTSGTTGRALRMEGIKIRLTQNNKSMITYRVHVSKIGWQGWKQSGQLAGTTGQSKAIEAVKIKLKGTYAKKYDVYYRVHVQHIGWLGWAKNGAAAGSTGMAVRTEAIQVKLVKKNAKVAGTKLTTISKPVLSYKGHCQTYGWRGKVKEGAVAGTTGKGKRLEALIINLKDIKSTNGITYRAHVSKIGWQGWKKSGQLAGTTGQGKAIEAVQIKLTGNNAYFYDVYYRMHVAGDGWLGWAKNGATAGTTGGGVRAEAIQIKLIRKGAPFGTGGAPYINKSKNGIILKHHMTQSMKQPYSGPCCAYAYGIGLSIILKQNVNPMQFYRNGYAHYDLGHISGDMTYNPAAIYNALKNGRPTMIHYIFPGNQHYVLINGVRDGANINNLQYSDFICIDSAYGDQRPLTSALNFSSATITEMKIFY